VLNDQRFKENGGDRWGGSCSTTCSSGTATLSRSCTWPNDRLSACVDAQAGGLGGYPVGPVYVPARFAAGGRTHTGRRHPRSLDALVRRTVRSLRETLETALSSESVAVPDDLRAKAMAWISQVDPFTRVN